MRRQTALLLAVAFAVAGCASDPRPGQIRSVAEAEAPPARGFGPAPFAVLGVLVGAGLVILLIANSGVGPSPDPPG